MCYLKLRRLLNICGLIRDLNARIAQNGKNVALLHLIFQYTPTFAATPASIEGLSFGKDIHINGAFFLVLLYIGEFVTK